MKFKRIVLVLMHLIFLVFIIFPLFKPYILGTADGLAHKFRLISFEKSIREGYLRPRWLSDQALGYGSPLFLFNYLLPYYTVAGIHNLGLGINISTQIYEALTLVFSYTGMYLLVSKLWGKKAGIVAAVVYTLAPYHLLTIYLYEGWGEFTAFVFPPWILYLIIRIQLSEFRIRNHNSKVKIFNFRFQFCILHFALLISIWSLFILSHNVSALFFSPVLIILAFMIGRNEVSSRNGLYVVGAFVMSVLITAFFWLPAITQNSLTAYPDLIARETAIRGSYFKSFSTIVSVAIGTILKGSTGYYDFTVGLPIFIGVIIACFFIVKEVIRKFSILNFQFSLKSQFSNIKFKYLDFISNYKFQIINLILFFLSLYLSNHSSNWLWNIPFMHYIVYPFRFLFPATFFGSLIAGFVSRENKYLALFFIILAIIAGLPYTNPDIDKFDFPDSYFQNVQTVFSAPLTKKNMATTEFLPRTANPDFLKNEEEKYFSGKKLPQKFEFKSGTEKILHVSVKSEMLQGEFDTEKPEDIAVNTFYFPNWKAYVDGKPSDIRMEGYSGRMLLTLPQGHHTLKMVFEKSRMEKTGDFISITGLVILMAAAIFLLLITVFSEGPATRHPSDLPG